MSFVLETREALLQGSASVRDLSTAFRMEGEARLQLALHATGRVSRGERPIVAALRTLIRALEIRLGIDRWCLAYGQSPDDLSSRAIWESMPKSLRSRLQGGTLAELALALSYLATPIPRDRRVLPALVRDQSPAAIPAVTLMVSLSAQDLAQSLDDWIAAAPHALGLWVADPSLGVRFNLSRQGVRFRAHHPVIHAALLERCRKSGIDLV